MIRRHALRVAWPDRIAQIAMVLLAIGALALAGQSM